MGDRAAKNDLYDGFALVAKALANGRRSEIVDLLAQGPRSVESIAVEIDQSVANTSHHLQVLARAGLLTSRRNGTHVIYALASARVGDLWRALRDVAVQHVAAIERLATAYLGDRTGFEAISREELSKRMRRGEIHVIDVRPLAEFEAGHIPGARSIPVEELRKHLSKLPKSKEIAAYCRGPYCVYADEAVRTLKRRGFRALRLEEGFPEWAEAGLPVAAGGEKRT